MARTVRVRVVYPDRLDQMVLRTDADWERDLRPVRVLPDDGVAEFDVTTEHLHFYFKPCLRDGTALYWAQGTNYLAVSSLGRRTVFPFFVASMQGSITDVVDVACPETGQVHKIRIYLPPGYEENTKKHYPVLYMHDGSNLFFPQEAFMGRDWGVDETMAVLDAMNVTDKVIVVGVYSQDRMRDYAFSTCRDYVHFLAHDLKPTIDALLRTRPEASHTGVMGSSMGGVVSLVLAWEHPEAFGMAACLSSTFGHEEEFVEQLRIDTRRPAVRLYLDSGWPGDNYEVTLEVFHVLMQKGYRFGSDILYLAYPNAAHDESYWAARLHVPFQFFYGVWSYAEEIPVGAAGTSPGG